MPPITQALIIANVVMFLIAGPPQGPVVSVLELWPLGVSPQYVGVPSFQPWQIITYSFLHAGAAHLFFNMFALYMFGGEVERLFGARRYLNLYVVSVIAAAITQLIVFAIRDGIPYPTVGASGGIFGLLLAYAIYFPNRSVIIIPIPIPLPARIFVIVYAALELYLGVTGTQEGVAHFAHLGGMVGAWIMIRYWSPFRRR